MRSEKTVFKCDSCGEEIKDGFIVNNGILVIKNFEVKEKTCESTTDQSELCKSCFKKAIGIKERSKKVDMQDDDND